MPSTSNSSTRYRGFLSYSHADRKFARKLHGYLESFKVPASLAGTPASRGVAREKLGAFFMDREELPSAPDLSNAIGEALTDSEFLIVICTPDSARSDYVNREVQEFKRLGRADRILCIIAEDVPASADPGKDCFCPALNFDLNESGELSDRTVEPIAADARRGADGYRGARLKLVAGLLGVGYDGLRQRELQRHNRRLVGIATASIAGMGFTIGLSMIALDARDTAERHREEADKLIGFMLGDLRSRLDEVGRLDILDSVVDKTISYFQNLPAEELNKRTRVQRSAALTQLGQVKDAKGELDEAKELFTAAHRELVDMCGILQQATDQSCLYALGQVQFWLANGDWLSANYATALDYFGDYAQTSQRLVELDPNSRDYQLELAMSYTNLAVLNNEQGNTQDALDLSARAVAIGEQLYRNYPADADVALAMANLYSWAGEYLYRDLQFEAALSVYKKYLAIADKGIEQSPKNSLWLDHQMMAHRELGQVYDSLGDRDNSIESFLDALEKGKQLLAIEPENQYWQEDLAVLRMIAIRVHLASGNFSSASQLQRENEEVIASQISRVPDSNTWASIQLSSEYLALRMGEKESDTGATTSGINPLLSRGRALHALMPNDKAALFSLVEILLAAARLEKKASNDQLASEHYEEALKLLETPKMAGGNPVRSLPLAARLHADMGVEDAQNQALQTLRRAGYKGYALLD